MERFVEHNELCFWNDSNPTYIQQVVGLASHRRVPVQRIVILLF